MEVNGLLGLLTTCLPVVNGARWGDLPSTRACRRLKGPATCNATTVFENLGPNSFADPITLSQMAVATNFIMKLTSVVRQCFTQFCRSHGQRFVRSAVPAAAHFVYSVCVTLYQPVSQDIPSIETSILTHYNFYGGSNMA